MELKDYQRVVIDDLSRFLSLLSETGSIEKAYFRLWEEKKVHVGFGGITPYQCILPGIPNVCLKVPTGGGKTFIAANAIKPIFDSLPFTKSKAVVWLVPSDTILEQTLKNLSDSHHPYRGKINSDFLHRVEVYSKNQLLSGQNFNPTIINEQLSVFILSYDSFRTSNKEGRKAFQENGNLAQFSRFFSDPSILLADTDETALIQVIRYLNPVVIVDESHHSKTTLSREMLENFNPSFVLDLTATPDKKSNIISIVDALQLKKANMVKLPVIVYNRRSQNDVISDAISIRDKLEAQAKQERTETGRYIRPIVLFQAEPKGNDTNTTFEKIKKSLLDIGIPENQIAIKTSDINELRGVDLLSEGCPVRYIITINALKEGWDCPFAYVLATIANRSSEVDVTQILGRILRLPYAEKNTRNILNISYVITSSSDFHNTLQKVVEGLNNAGFSDKDYRIGLADDCTDRPPVSYIEQTEIHVQQSEADIESDIDTKIIKEKINEVTSITNTSTDELFAAAIGQLNEYEEVAAKNENPDIDAAPLEVREYMKTFRMNEQYSEEASKIRLPQFVIPLNIPMFSDDKSTLLTPEHLSEGFSLRGKGTDIDFTSLEGEIARVDINESKDALPKAWKLTGADNQYFRNWFNSQTPEWRIKQCKDIISKQLSKINAVSDKDLFEYVGRVVDGLSPEQAEDLQQSPHIYASKIKKKIDNLLEVHREKVFDLWIEQGKITCEPTYAFKQTISPLRFTSVYAKSLYSAEEEMNGLEKDVVAALTALNIKWWHRNISRTGFNINGYINAYPDIIALTASGKILLIEPKGDHLENTESRNKVKIGRIWQNKANIGGDKYRYFMVFRDKDLHVDGAYHFDRFIEIARGL